MHCFKTSNTHTYDEERKENKNKDKWLSEASRAIPWEEMGAWDIYHGIIVSDSWRSKWSQISTDCQTKPAFAPIPGQYEVLLKLPNTEPCTSISPKEFLIFTFLVYVLHVSGIDFRFLLCDICTLLSEKSYSRYLARRCWYITSISRTLLNLLWDGIRSYPEVSCTGFSRILQLVI